MPFNYSKVGNDSTDGSEDTLEEQHKHVIRTRRSKFARVCGCFAVLRWPVVLLLLSTILICELSILYKQTAAMPIGGEINKLVPYCMLYHNTQDWNCGLLIFRSLTATQNLPCRRALRLGSQNPRIYQRHQN